MYVLTKGRVPLHEFLAVLGSPNSDGYDLIVLQIDFLELSTEA
jgi:hypothetical protein